jgi:homoserine kinase
MSAGLDSVSVRVPASTSNCGSGFDTLGLALKLYNRVTLSRLPGTSCEAERPDDARAQAMVAEAAEAFAEATGRRAGVRYRIEGDVPVARGLGSSVTVIAGVLAGLDAIHGTDLGKQRLVELATELEGHPDNASAGILGGFCVARSDPSSGAFIRAQRFAVPPSVAFVVASPSLELMTKESRGALPLSLPFFDAVKSVNAAAYLVAAFASGSFERLAEVSGDFIHEPYRLPRIPGAAEAVGDGVAAGAWTGWLSGSGSSVLCVCPKPMAQAVLASMTSAFARASLGCEGRILEADNEGISIV